MQPLFRRIRNLARQWSRPPAAAARLVGGSSSPNMPALPSGWTDYMTWLSFANAGMLERGNVDAFDFVIRNLPGPAPMVEIGSFCGLSTNVITHLKEKYAVKNRLVTCDRWIFEGAQPAAGVGGSPSLTHAEYRDFVRGSYIRNIQTFARYDLPYTVEMVSDDFFAAWAQRQTTTDVLGRSIELGGPISFCYVDGNHSYEFVQRDFSHIDQFLEPGGFVLFDDSSDGSAWEVCRVVAEVKSGGRYDVVAANPNYLFRKK